jgi:heptose-I-phosphate ethanolaminephosphotransferase
MNSREKVISLLILLSIFIPFSALRNFRTPFDPWLPTKVIKKFIVANKELRLASILQAGYNHPAESIYPSSQTIALIIGESAGRRNMHLYGYPRQTTPDMERIHDLHVFTDVISCAPTTHKSIGMMLTLADLNNAAYTTTVFDMFKAANFKTFWISAQFSKQSPGSGIVPILAQRADSLWSLKQNLSPAYHYDEYIIPRVLEVIDDPAPKKLIVINLLGSHTSYKERIPAHRSNFKFTEPPPATATFKNFFGHDNVAQIINDYDASIRYTDFVVSRIFESLEERNSGAWAAIYLSDHGEEVFDTENRFGHAGSSTSRNVYEIPFVLKISNDYMRWMRDTEIFTLDTTRPYQTDNLIHTLLNLAAIKTPLYDPAKSVVNPNFQALPRWIKNTPYAK